MRLGVWGANMNTAEYEKITQKSIELGVTTFDHADIYGHYTTEGEFGKMLKNQPNLREKMEIITKCGINLTTPNRPNHKIKSYDTSKAHIIKSAENSLKELGTDYLDLLLIHRPSPLMQPDEIAEAFTQLRVEGKVLHFGVSNFTPSQFSMLNECFKLVTNQVEISIHQRATLTDGTLDQCIEKGIKPMAWSPLGGGKIFTDLEDTQVKRIRKVGMELMEKHGATGLDQILLAWLLKHPAGILPVLGTTKIARLETAANSLKIELTDEEWFELLEASVGSEVA
jgi:predicted oxidoreductase